MSHWNANVQGISQLAMFDYRIVGYLSDLSQLELESMNYAIDYPINIHKIPTALCPIVR
jgi:hypothetical protein